MFFLIKDYPFKDKYLLCVFSHNKFPICGEMAGWGDSGSQTGSKTTPSGGFVTPRKYPRIFIIILLYILGIN